MPVADEERTGTLGANVVPLPPTNFFSGGGRVLESDPGNGTVGASYDGVEVESVVFSTIVSLSAQRPSYTVNCREVFAYCRR